MEDGNDRAAHVPSWPPQNKKKRKAASSSYIYFTGFHTAHLIKDMEISIGLYQKHSHSLSILCI